MGWFDWLFGSGEAEFEHPDDFYEADFFDDVEGSFSDPDTHKVWMDSGPIVNQEDFGAGRFPWDDDYVG